MKLLAIGAVIAAAGAFALQDKERPVTDDERTRFLFHGVFEGLVEDGAQADVVEQILARRDEWFVKKCPICLGVQAGFRAYAGYARDNGWKSPRRDGLPPWFGAGFPAATVEGLKSDNVKTRHQALQGLVERYVKNRFERVKMSQEARIRMQESLKLGMKEGLEYLKSSGTEDLFPSSCPSCEGAN